MANPLNQPPGAKLGDKLAQSLERQADTRQATQEAARRLYETGSTQPSPTPQEERKP